MSAFAQSGNAARAKGGALPRLYALARIRTRRKIGLGCRQAGDRHCAMLFRNSWNAFPSSDCENGYDSNGQQDAHGRSPLVARESPSLWMIGTLVAAILAQC
jgi:hypothetical protein